MGPHPRADDVRGPGTLARRSATLNAMPGFWVQPFGADRPRRPAARSSVSRQCPWRTPVPGGSSRPEVSTPRAEPNSSATAGMCGIAPAQPNDPATAGMVARPPVRSAARPGCRPLRPRPPALSHPAVPDDVSPSNVIQNSGFAGSSRLACVPFVGARSGLKMVPGYHCHISHQHLFFR
jgi:hypothetical protein